MNWLLIVVLVVILFCIMHGYHRGFLRIAYSLVAWLLIFAFVSWMTPYITDFLVNNTGIYESIETKFEEQLRLKAEEKVQDSVEDTGTEASENVLADLGISLPSSVSEKLYEQTAGMASDVLDESGIYESVASGMANFLVNGISFFIALAIALVVSRIIEHFLNFVSHIPILGGINRTLGLFAGIVYGLFIVWLAFYLIALCSSSETGAMLYSYIQESALLTMLYENNPIVSILLYFL